MQLEMSFAEKATAVAKYEPKAIKQDGEKIWGLTIDPIFERILL